MFIHQEYQKQQRLLNTFGARWITLTLLCPACFENFYEKNVSHMALQEHNSSAENRRELLKGSKDSASLLVCTQKELFGWGVRIFS